VASTTGAARPQAPADSSKGSGAALERLIERWAVAATSQAKVRAINDPEGLVATVVGIDGAWGFGSSSEEALGDLQSVLIDWATLKLEDGDEDIPSMEGLDRAADHPSRLSIPRK